MRNIDNLTFFIFVAFWPVYLIWEIALFVMRGKGMNVDLISMEARDRGYQFNTLVVLWFALPVHFWVNWYRPAMPNMLWATIVFWVFIAATLTFDLILLNRGIMYDQLPQALQIYRWPLTQAVLGVLAAYFLFPQRGVLP
jgi:hypothetical protein